METNKQFTISLGLSQGALRLRGYQSSRCEYTCEIRQANLDRFLALRSSPVLNRPRVFEGISPFLYPYADERTVVPGTTRPCVVQFQTPLGLVSLEGDEYHPPIQLVERLRVKKKIYVSKTPCEDRFNLWRSRVVEHSSKAYYDAAGELYMIHTVNKDDAVSYLTNKLKRARARNVKHKNRK